MADTALSQRSEQESLRRLTISVVARAAAWVGPEASRQIDRSIDLVRAICEPEYTAGDLQVDQMHAAKDPHGTDLVEHVSGVDELDRCMLLRHVCRIVASTGQITPENAEFLESIGRMLQLGLPQIEHVVIGVMQEFANRE